MRKVEKDKSFLQTSKKKMSSRVSRNSKKDCLHIFISRTNTRPRISEEIKVLHSKCMIMMIRSQKKEMKMKWETAISLMKTKWKFKSLSILF